MVDGWVVLDVEDFGADRIGDHEIDELVFVERAALVGVESGEDLLDLGLAGLGVLAGQLVQRGDDLLHFFFGNLAVVVGVVDVERELDVLLFAAVAGDHERRGEQELLERDLAALVLVERLERDLGVLVRVAALVGAAEYLGELFLIDAAVRVVAYELAVPLLDLVT